MFININGMFETYEVTFEIFLEDKLIGRQTMEAPKELIMASFAQKVNQIKDDKRPLKVRVTRPEVIWDNFENKEKTLTNEVSFSNNAMVAYEESKAGDSND